jgi:hypothetical protein
MNCGNAVRRSIKRSRMKPPSVANRMFVSA